MPRLALPIAALIAPTLAAPTLTAQGQRPTPAVIAHAIDSLTTRAIADGLAPALGVAVTMEGRTIYARSQGFADVATRRPVNDRTLWYLASTSKSLTGFGIALLADAGTIRLDAPITTLLPRARWNPAVHADSLTLAQFLSHTHRVNDDAVVTSAAFTGEIPEARWPELLALAPRAETADLVYTNLGYNVAAMVIDAVRPEGWRAYLERAVYRPAGMRDTYARTTGLRDRIPLPHRLRADGSFTPEPFYKTDATMNSAGGHVATLHDLARWTIVQMDDGVIDGRRVYPASAVALAHRLIARHTVQASKRFAYFDREGWASGWDIGAYEGEPMVSRFGSWFTTRSHLSFLPRRRIGVVVLSSAGISQVTDAIAAYAYDLEAGRPDAAARSEARMAELRARLATLRRNAAVSDSTRAARQRQPLGRPLADFTGAFSEPSYGTITFTATGGRLAYRWGAVYGPAEIYDASKAQLRIEVAGSGDVVTLGFDGAGPARTVTVQGVTFTRR